MTEKLTQPNSGPVLMLYYQNVRSLKNKIDLFYNASSSSTYDFICITESWLIDSISSSEFIDINKYSVIRRDRDLTATDSSRGGGVLLA